VGLEEVLRGMGEGGQGLGPRVTDGVTEAAAPDPVTRPPRVVGVRIPTTVPRETEAHTGNSESGGHK